MPPLSQAIVPFTTLILLQLACAICFEDNNDQQRLAAIEDGVEAPTPWLKPAATKLTTPAIATTITNAPTPTQGYEAYQDEMTVNSFTVCDTALVIPTPATWINGGATTGSILRDNGPWNPDPAKTPVEVGIKMPTNSDPCTIATLCNSQAANPVNNGTDTHFGYQTLNVIQGTRFPMDWTCIFFSGQGASIGNLEAFEHVGYSGLWVHGN